MSGYEVLQGMTTLGRTQSWELGEPAEVELDIRERLAVPDLVPGLVSGGMEAGLQHSASVAKESTVLRRRLWFSCSKIQWDEKH